MIQLHPDCLLFKTPGGEAIPCSAELISVNLLGEAADLLDPDLVENAARAVLHYFKVEQGKTFVSMREFSLALAKVLRGFGMSVNLAEAAAPPRRISESDLRQLACESGKGFELAFFPRLRDELRQQLNQSPQVLRFKGLRSCVKQLAGARRWTGRCQRLSDQIVEYLRHCLSNDPGTRSCSLMVR
jgi:hypothetical protein